MGSTSYLTRGKANRGTYGTYKPAKSTSSIGSDKDIGSKLKRTKARRSGKLGDYTLKRAPDYTELAYKEAVSRLRYFLSGNLAHGYRGYGGGAASIKNLDESDNEEKKYHPPAPVSYSSGGVKSRLTAKYSQLYADSLRNFNQFPNDTASKASSGGAEPNATSPEVVHFIQKQEEYIEQLERESQYCRDELNNLLGKVKEVISENEHLHEAQKNKLISRMFDSYGGSETDDLDDIGDSTGLDSDTKTSPSKVRKSAKPGRSSRLEGPNIVFESRIAELEAQLTQAKIEQKKIQDENNENRRKLAEGLVDSSCLDGFKRQIDNLQRDKASLEAQISKLKLNLDQRDSDSDLGSRIKRGSDLVEQQLREERNNLEAEVRRLKEDLNSQRGKVRELAGEGARRAIQERSAAEQRYTSHLDEMASELAAQYDNVSKLQLELDRQRRDELDLKRELSMKTAAIDELKMELKGKTASLQADLAQAHAEKSSLEEELASARLAIERHQRQAKHETNRFNSEIQSLRQRLDRADADLVHSRRENLRLSEEIAKLEKDLKLGNLTPASPVKSNKDKELANMLENMENKHAHTVAELEAMIQSQNSLMDKLTGECRVLTDKLDHASRRHKQSAESQPNRPTNENTARRLRPGKREPPFLQTPRKRVRFVEQELAALQRQVEGISQSFQQPASISAPTANTYQAPAPITANIQDSSRTHTPTRNDYPRTEPARDTQVHREPSDTGNGDHHIGQARKLSKKTSRDTFVTPVAPNQNYNNDDIQIPPDKFEEKDDNTTEKEHKIKDEPQYDVDADVIAKPDTEGNISKQAYEQPQYKDQNDQQQQQNEYQPQYQTDSKTYPQDQTYTDQQYNDTQPEYEGSEYNQGYAAEYTDGQYQNQAQYPNQQYTEGEYADQTYEQQQYDYSTDPNYQSSADQNYQGDQNYVTDPNYQSTVDPNYAADPNYQTAPDPNYAPDPSYQTTADPNYSADPSYQTVTNPNYEADPSYQTATNPNYEADPSYQTATNPNYEADSSYQNTTQPNYETDPKYASTVSNLESTLKPGNNSPNPQNKS